MNGKSFLALLVTIVFVAALSFSAFSAFAQDATATPSGTGSSGEATAAVGGTGDTVAMANCDSDLILSLYIAERFFGFSSFNRQMAPGMVIDTNSYNRGQFTTLFDAIEPNSSVVGITDESRSNLNGLLGLNDTEFNGQMNTTMRGTSENTLTEGTFADDSTECAALRLSLRRFYTSIAMSDSQMGGFNSNSGNTGNQSSTGTNNNQSGTGTNNNNQAGTSTGTSNSTSTSNAGTQGTSTGTSNNQAGTDTSSNQPGTGTGNAQIGSANAQAGVITINLASSAEFPGPGDENVSGIATVYLRPARNMVCVDIIVNGVVQPIAAATIFRGTAGTAGTAVVSLNAPGASGVSNSCVTVDPALMQEMLNNPENFYVSISNAAFPNGAARGQLR